MRAPKSFEDGMARLETILSQMHRKKRLSKWRRSTPPAAKRQTPKQKNKSNQLAGRNHYGERRV